MFKSNGYAPQLIAHKHPKSAAAEAYRVLRTNLGFAALDHPCRSILVTSAGPEDGKSTTAANLAVVLAQAGNKVILVDCDLRKPVLHKIFEVENHRGLTNCLLQNLDPAEVSKNGLVENLTLVTSGPIPPNPAELLGSGRVRALWPALLERFDYLIVDSPPVLAVTDASLLAAQVDGVILVVRAATTRVEIAREARDQLLKASARIIGVVLNQVKMPARDYHYYYYYHRREKEEEVRL
ncbi:CpsD/CapB family tyrosine-protein kinase [Desulfofundulus thermosubterraneus]|uniref:non-specific protein-tyrosine kinase n=1 Tax=Desulfofundulus thermosubterraneus DSM 16057 TaxID=1121432 RepID=A0A1M6LPX4_9FIRM|nr:CpsD/CapB family tyrosine-protein kinase [Desulfofundulus thermosubterraneus]SHJ73254.1 CobQ/CobB/MinD/ParA nucleotide binding domain-containing protein [Desulfofundulus thermosubterraneus DSM 16057]